MIFRIGLENNIEGRSLAWVLGHPGCFSVGRNRARASCFAEQSGTKGIRPGTSGSSWHSPIRMRRTRCSRTNRTTIGQLAILMIYDHYFILESVRYATEKTFAN